MKTFRAKIVLAIFFQNCLFCFSQNNNMVIIDEINEKYNAIEFDQPEGKWNWKTNKEIFANAFLHYFENEETFYVDNSIYFPFIECTASKDGKIKIYSWICYKHIFDDGIVSSVGYDSLIQYKTSSGKIGAKLISDVIKRPCDFEICEDVESLETKYTGIFNLDNNIYIFVGNRLVDGHSKIISFFTIELHPNEIVEHNSFDRVVALQTPGTFKHFDESWIYCFILPYPYSMRPVVSKYRYDFTVKPYKIIFYINDDEAFEFIYDSLEKKFKGNYEYFLTRRIF